MVVLALLRRRERDVEGRDEAGQRPYRKLSAEERATFLEVLRETGNRRRASRRKGGAGRGRARTGPTRWSGR